MLHSKFKLRIVLLFLFTFLLVSLITQNNFAQQSKLVESLDISGNRRLDDKDILKYIKTRHGDKFDEKQIQADLQAILQSGLFNKSNTRVLTEPGLRGGVIVIFEVMESPLITEVKFNGLRYVSKEELLAVLREQSAEINPNDSYQPETARKAIEIIKEYLIKKRGFINAKVYATEEETTATTLKFAFVIDEMPNDNDF